MATGKFDRLFVTPVLPYRPGTLDIDEEALRRLLRYFLQPKFVEAGGAIIINPVAGEVFFLSRAEKKRVVEIAVEECGGRVPVVAGAIDWTTEATVEDAVNAKRAGADGIFIMPPSGPTDITIGWDAGRHPEIWLDMIAEIDRAVNLPMVAHPTAPPSGDCAGGFPAESALQACRSFPNILGWKMTYRYEDFLKVARALRSLDRHVAILGASAGFFHEYLANDLLDGTASGGWNYAMELMVDHIEAWRRNDIARAKGLWPPLKRLHAYVHQDKAHHHLRYKVGAWLRGLIPSPFMRPPMPRPEREEVLKLKELLQAAGFDVIGDREIEETLENAPAEAKKAARRAVA